MPLELCATNKCISASNTNDPDAQYPSDRALYSIPMAHCLTPVCAASSLARDLFSEGSFSCCRSAQLISFLPTGEGSPG